MVKFIIHSDITATRKQLTKWERTNSRLIYIFEKGKNRDMKII